MMSVYYNRIGFRRLYPVRNNAMLLPPGQRPRGPAAAAGLHFNTIPAGFNPLRQRLRSECLAGISNGVCLIL